MTWPLSECHLQLVADQKQLEDDVRQVFVAVTTLMPNLIPPQWMRSTMTKSPGLGLNAYCFHPSLPRNHIICFFIAADPQTETIYWENNSPTPVGQPEWALAFLGEITTHQRAQQWHPDPDSGEIWIHRRDLLSGNIIPPRLPDS